MARFNLIWLGIGFLLSYGIAKVIIIPRLRKEKLKALVLRLSVYVLIIGFWIVVLGIALLFDQFFRHYLWYRLIVWTFLGGLVWGALSVVLVWVRTSVTLRRRRPLKVFSPLRKHWYIVEVRPDFSKPLEDRIKRIGGRWDDVARIRPHLSKPRQLVPQNHIICLDGTWNDAESETNVHRLFKLLSDTCDNGEPQIARYYTGVGINENQGLSVEVLGEKVTKGLIQSATGLGERTIRWLAYLDLVATYQPGDRVFIFGFSRGASSARILANHICEYGIPKWLQAKFMEAPKDHGKPRGPDELRDLAVLDDEKWDVEIEMMGLWDTVAAFGLPSNKFEAFRKLTIPDNVRKTYHLVAIDEKRWEFDATLIEHDARNGRTEEIWFAGAHTNVGGGFSDRSGKEQTGLSDIALRFMINQALDHRICFKPEWASELKDDVRGAEWPLWRMWPPWFTRRIRVKGGAPEVLPRIHKSVFMRKDAGIGYCPPNVKEIEKIYTREGMREERD